MAGAAGVAGMAGVITSLRRAILTSEELAGSKWHPEKVVEAVAERAGYAQPDDQTRRRLGDTIHYGYGAMWGVALAMATSGKDVRPIKHGVPMAAGLWGLGFGAVLPAVGAHPPFWTWKTPREFLLTGSAHITWGVATATVLKALRA
jgi:hypothetical protein